MQPGLVPVGCGEVGTYGVLLANAYVVVAVYGYGRAQEVGRRGKAYVELLRHYVCGAAYACLALVAVPFKEYVCIKSVFLQLSAYGGSELLLLLFCPVECHSVEYDVVATLSHVYLYGVALETGSRQSVGLAVQGNAFYAVEGGGELYIVKVHSLHRKQVGNNVVAPAVYSYVCCRQYIAKFRNAERLFLCEGVLQHSLQTFNPPQQLRVSAFKPAVEREIAVACIYVRAVGCCRNINVERCGGVPLFACVKHNV